VLLALACVCSLLAAACGNSGPEPSVKRGPEARRSALVPPAAPARYKLPERARWVFSARELRRALAARGHDAIVLAPGTYGGRRPFANPHGHQLYAAQLGRAILTSGLSLGGNHGNGGGLVQGLVFDVRNPRRTVDGAAILVWGTGRGSRILDTTLRGHRRLNAGVAARRTEGLVMQRVVVRGFRDFGVLVDANDANRPRQREPFRISDLDVADIARPTPGSSMGRSEACVWIGDSGSLRRVRARSCAAAGLWTGTATRGAHFESIDVDRASTGVYIEHFTSDSTFRALRVGPRVRVGLNAEWADPDWGRRPASDGNVIEDSRFESRLVGVYLDEGTTRTTVRRSTFANQTWGAVGDFRGKENVIYGNDYGGAAVRHDHLSSPALPASPKSRR
jgi:hypothetical protein